MRKRIIDVLLHSIHGRLILLAAAVVVPSLMLAALLVIEANRNERAVVERQMHETARALSLVVDRQLGQSEAMLKALATSPDLVQGDLAAFRRQAIATVPEDDRWIVLTDENGAQLMNTDAPEGTPLPQAAAPPDRAPTLRRGHTYISNLLPSTARPGYALSVTIPLREQGQRTNAAPAPYAALSLVMRPETLSDILADQKLPEAWVAAIIDREGTIVARNRLANQFVGGKATPDIRTLVLRKVQEGVVESVTLDGVATLAAFSRSPSVGWTVIIGAPKSELYASAVRLMLIALAVSFVLVAVGIAMYVWVARGVVRSVEVLTASAGTMGRGQVPALVSTGMRETDEVAEALRDAAERLRVRESELKRLNETLEARVQARTAEYAEVNHALSIRNRELQDFAYVASHDLQEPLRKVQSFADLLASEYAEAVGEDGKHYIMRMQAAAERMSRLISDLLAFSRVTTQTQPAVPVDLNETLASVLSDLEVRIAEVDGRIEAPALATVRADPVQMHQLLLNLIGNGLKFHRPGVPPVIHVCTEEEESHVRIVVEDNGIGFDEQYAERIFAPFQRLHGKDSYEGTGMGLAIVRRIAERHGGTASATSTQGEGSRFEVKLPTSFQEVEAQQESGEDTY